MLLKKIYNIRLPLNIFLVFWSGLWHFYNFAEFNKKHG